jgi:hypothetical protein
MGAGCLTRVPDLEAARDALAGVEGLGGALFRDRSTPSIEAICVLLGVGAARVPLAARATSWFLPTEWSNC